VGAARRLWCAGRGRPCRIGRCRFPVGALLCFGHRGAAGYEPENTIRGIQRALAMGVDGIEIDARCARDDLVVMHDATLDRTTNGSGYVARKTLAALRSLDAGLGERIPTLREVLAAVDRRALVNVELKGRGTARAVEALIDEFVQTHGWQYEDFLVSSFHRTELAQLRLRQLRKGLLVTRPFPGWERLASRLRVRSIHIALRHTRAAFVQRAHLLGYEVFVYTVNAAADFARMRDAGVDGVFTDFPDRMMKPF
jgi:glycerophosphoryl diester phosphodiesterase